MKALDKMINKGFVVRIWEDRYSASIRAALGREYDRSFQTVCELTDSGDIEAAGFSEYINGVGEWLPFSCAETAEQALADLNKKLEKLPETQLERTSQWAEAVDSAYSKLLKISDGGYGIALAIDANALPIEPVY